MKNYAYILLTIILGLIAAGDVTANVGPSNDNFAGAMPLVLSGGTAGITTTNVDASKEAGEPNHAEDLGGRSVWFKFTPAITKVIRINTVDTTFDTLLAVYTGNAV